MQKKKIIEEHANNTKQGYNSNYYIPLNKREPIDASTPIELFINTIPKGVIIADLEFHIHLLNEEAKRLLQLDSSQYQGRNFCDFIKPEICNNFKSVCDHIIQGKTSGTFSIQLLTDPKVSIICNISLVQVHSNNFLSIYLDHVLHEHSNTELLSNIFHHFSEPVACVDNECRVIAMNEEMERLLNYYEPIKNNDSNDYLLTDIVENFDISILSGIKKTPWTERVALKNGPDSRAPICSLTITPYADNSECFIVSLKNSNNPKKENDDLYNLAHYDQLTGLPNRYLFNKYLDQLIRDAENNHEHISILFLDLDNFKNINDTHGHHFGDELLKQAAKRLMDCCRGDDMVARIGGDEFTILLHAGKGKEFSPLDISKRIISDVQKPFYIEGHEFFTSVSIGLSNYPIDGTDANSLVKNADIAMYQAKRQGKSNYQCFTSDMHDEIVRRNIIEGKLRYAIDRNELHLVYQPIVNLNSGNIIGAEALLRWKPDDEEMISPAEFIPIAEESDLIVKLGYWVIENAINTLAYIKSSGFSDLYISINLAPRQFNEDKLLNIIQKKLDAKGVNPSSLVLEITEHTLIKNMDETTQKMHELVNLGLKISIDDFGTGHSSLNYLRNFPISTLKIDKSFIDGLWYGEGDLTIINTIINLGQNLGLQIIAEGVETETQLMFLKSRHCDHLQGYYFSPPVSELTLMEILKSGRKLT